MMQKTKQFSNFLKHITQDVLSLALPPTCIACKTMLDKRAPIGVCPLCYATLPFWQAQAYNAEITTPPLPKNVNSFQAPFLYRDVIKNLVRAFKFEDHPEYAKPLAQHMVACVKDTIEKNKDVLQHWVIVPVPIHKKRMMKRYFNQSALLAKHISEQTQITCDYTSLIRQKHTKPQLGQTANQRKKNLVGAFKASNVLSGKNVILVDDVWTTGSTAQQCAQALKQAGVLGVHVVTLAYVVPGESDK